MALAKLPDAVLIKQYMDGNEWAFSQLIKRHEKKVFGFIFSKVADEDLANDIFQDTYIKIIHTLKNKNYQEEGKFLQFTMRIAHNLIIDHYRKSSKVHFKRDTEEYSVFQGLQDYTPNIELLMIDGQIEEDLKKMIDLLPYDQKEVIMLRIYDDLSFKEIAETTNVSINTALGRMRYALINLRKIIAQKQIILE
ncbi:MAG TPA: sigma-70 family RNA polymerase sigma factor [Flavobacterium sp.]|nr:sigma-70 family RNA polymerase sigma factor [Flavobacterium sp.]